MCSETSEAVGTTWEHAQEIQKFLKIRITSGTSQVSNIREHQDAVLVFRWLTLDTGHWTGQWAARCVDVQVHAVDVHEVQDQVQDQVQVRCSGWKVQDGSSQCFGHSWSKVLVAGSG